MSEKEDKDLYSIIDYDTVGIKRRDILCYDSDKEERHSGRINKSRRTDTNSLPE